MAYIRVKQSCKKYDRNMIFIRTSVDIYRIV